MAAVKPTAPETKPAVPETKPAVAEVKAVTTESKPAADKGVPSAAQITQEMVRRLASAPKRQPELLALTCLGGTGNQWV